MLQLPTVLLEESITLGKIVIQPVTISEQLLYNTVRIVGLINETPSSFGTGFFYRFSVDESKSFILILTNKHVIANNRKFSFVFHELSDDGQKPSPLGQSIKIIVDDVSPFWVPHPDPGVDLGAIFFAPIQNEITKLNKKVYFSTLDDSIIKSDDELNEISSVADDILMAGYPNGLWDDKANFPLIRKGITASHPAIDFQGKSIGVADIACFPGSSGSPILIVKNGGYTDKKGNTILGKNIIVLLGLLSSGPVLNEEGNITIKDIPSKKAAVATYKQMLHLGYFVKAKEILKLCKHIKEMYIYI